MMTLTFFLLLPCLTSTARLFFHLAMTDSELTCFTFVPNGDEKAKKKRTEKDTYSIVMPLNTKKDCRSGSFLKLYNI